MTVTMLDARNVDEWDGTKLLVSGSQLIFVESQLNWFATRAWKASQSDRLTVFQRCNKSLTQLGAQIQNLSTCFGVTAIDLFPQCAMEETVSRERKCFEQPMKQLLIDCQQGQLQLADNQAQGMNQFKHGISCMQASLQQADVLKTKLIKDPLLLDNQSTHDMV